MNSRRRTESIYYGWWVVGVLVVAEMMAYGSGFYAFTLFMKPLIAEFGWSRSLTSGSISMFWITAPLVPFIGSIAQRIDARWLIVGGILLESICFVAVGGISSAWQLYALRASMGFGKVVIAVAVPVVVARWFRRRAGIALGIAYSGTYIGGFVLSSVTQLLITHFGWRPAAVALGVLIPLAVVPPALWALRFRDPEQLGLKCDGKDFGDVPSFAENRNLMESGLTVREAVKTSTFWILLALTSAFHSAYAAILIHESAYLTDLGLRPQIAANLVGLTLASCAPSVLIYGFAIDRWRPRIVLTSSFALLSMAIGALLLLSNPDQTLLLVVFVTLFGLACGGVDVAIVNIIRMCFGTRQFGTLYGCYYFVSLTIFTIAPVVTGHVYDVTHSYSLAFMAAGLGALVGLIILAFAPLQNLGEPLYAGSAPQRSAAR